VERKSATYHRAEAARARSLLAEATTPRLKEHLEAAIARHEQIAAKVENASESEMDAACSKSGPLRLQERPPKDC
jgi:hypothetical protein